MPCCLDHFSSSSKSGSACLFYADVAGREDPWADERTSRVWIQGDLHAENFGTYMDGERVDEIRIVDGMEFSVGPAILKFIESGI